MSIAFRFITKAFTGDASLGVLPYQINGVDIVQAQIYFNNMVIFQGEGINKDPNTFWKKYHFKVNVKQNYTKHIQIEDKFVSKVDNLYTYDIIATRMENFDVIITARQPENKTLDNPVFQFGDVVFEYLTFYQACKKIRDSLNILYMQPAGNMIDLSYSENMTGIIKKAQSFSIKYKCKIAGDITQENLQSVLLEYKSISSNDSIREGEILIQE